MKLAMMADIHCHPFPEFSTLLPNGMNSRLADILSCFDSMREHCLENGITDVLLLGDIFHVRGRIETTVYNAVYRTLKKFPDQGINLMMMVGNHDQAVKDGEEHALEPFKEFAKVIDKPQLIRLDGLYVWAIPYIHDPELLKKEIQRGKWELHEMFSDNPGSWEEHGCPKQLMALHTGLDGAGVGSINYIMKEPLTLEDIQPDDWDWVAMGHYHKPQFLADNVFYIGAPIQHNFGDEGDPRGFMVLDTDSTDEPVSFFDLTDIQPKFRTIEIDHPSDLEGLQLDPKDYHRFQIRTQLVDVSQATASLAGDIKVRVEKEPDLSHENRLDLNDDGSSAVSQYVKHVNPELDHDRLIRLGNELMEGAL